MVKKVFFSSPILKNINAYSTMKEYNALALSNSIELIHPYEFVNGNPVMTKSYDEILELISDCDLLLADLNSYRYVDIDTITSFEIGYAKALRKTCLGYIDNSHIALKDRYIKDDIWHKDNFGFVDANTELKIEDFGLPINFITYKSLNMLLEGSFATIIKKV